MLIKVDTTAAEPKPEFVAKMPGTSLAKGEVDAITGFSPDTKVFNNRDAAKGKATLEWANGLYRDMFNA